jgi:capsular exopolysaccharide synthesis family protein
MESNPYILPLIKWWRLIAVVTLLAVGVSIVSTMLQPDIYESRTTLVVGTTFLNPNPDPNQLFIAQQLAGIYADMASREPIQNATMAALGINWLPEYKSRVVPNTQMVEISVADTNPKRAQIIANELAKQLQLQSPTQNQPGPNRDFIKAQLDSLQAQIVATDKNIQDLQKSLIGLNSASEIANIQKQISQQTDKLSSLRANYASFLANSQSGAANIVSVVEPANLPSRPTGTSKFIIVFLAGMVGFGLGTGAAYLLEFLDRTIKSTSDVERIFNLPVIGYISEISDEESGASPVVKNPDSILSENFRLLRSNIEFYRISNPAKTIMITSPSQGTGKTTIASNLALSISQQGGNVILVDADLRRPAVHRHLKMARKPGLHDVITNQTDIQSVVKQYNSKVSLKVITAGNIPAKITEIAGSRAISEILMKLKDNYELIIVDSPPLIIADSFNLASAVDAVILVLEPGETREEQAKTIKEQLGRANAKILGIVFNKVSDESANSHYDYQYRSLYSPKYYGGYAGRASKQPSTVSHSKGLLDLFEHGTLPPESAANLQRVIAAIKSQAGKLFNRSGKSKGEDKP